jgi:uncharacterized protein YceK
MRKRAAIFLAAVVFGALSGCGTSLNLDGDSRIYGGVAQDLQVVQERLGEAASPNWPGMPGSSTAWNLAVGSLALADVPLSLLADTLTLPYTIPTALDDRKESATSPSPSNPYNPSPPAGQSRPAGVSMGW